MYYDLTKGNIAKGLIGFSLPMIAGDLLQQFYNIADTMIVGRVIGKTALAAVGSAYTLMTFLISIFLGLSMGSGALFSIYKGKGAGNKIRISVAHAFLLIMGITVVINLLVYIFMDPILMFLRVPDSVTEDMRQYLYIIYAGLIATSIYNFFACLLRAVGNSTVPLYFLAVSAVLNIGLDLLFVAVFGFGVKGAAAATVISQYVSGVGIMIYAFFKCKEFLPVRSDFKYDKTIFKEITELSSMTCLQQSVMNFGILMVQGLVNSFGATVMAAFAVAVKIDTFAYLPVQDFGNAYSTFVAQNYGAADQMRIKDGTKTAFILSIIFGAVISCIVFAFAPLLMRIFVSGSESSVIFEGVRYLRIEGAFYFGIGCLFLLYGYYRAIKKAHMSLVLTIISLGLRVVLAYVLSYFIGVVGIWVSIPIGWMIADATGIIVMQKNSHAPY